MEEAAAIRMGMKMAQEAKWKAVEFQSDYKAIIDMIREGNVKESRVAVLLEDIQKMKDLFDQCTFSFVNKIGNSLCTQSSKVCC